MNELANKNSARYVGWALIFGAAIGSGIGIVLGDAIFGDSGSGLTFGASIGLVLGIVYGTLRKNRKNVEEKGD